MRKSERRSISFAGAALLSGLFLFTVSCDNSIPPPPKAHPELLLEIYDAMAKKEHHTAVAKIEKLRAIEKTSVFLSELESVERNNILFGKVNKLIAAGNFAAAQKILLDQEVLHGTNDDSAEAMRQLQALAQLNALMTEAAYARTSFELKQTLAELNKVAKKIMISQKMQNFIRKKESDIKIMETVERDRMLFSMLSDAGQMISAGSVGGPALTASLALEEGNNPEIADLLTKISGQQ